MRVRSERTSRIWEGRWVPPFATGAFQGRAGHYLLHILSKHTSRFLGSALDSNNCNMMDSSAFWVLTGAHTLKTSTDGCYLRDMMVSDQFSICVTGLRRRTAVPRTSTKLQHVLREVEGSFYLRRLPFKGFYNSPPKKGCRGKLGSPETIIFASRTKSESAGHFWKFYKLLVRIPLGGYVQITVRGDG